MLSDPEVGVEKLLGLLALDSVAVIADHRPLLEPGPDGARERHPTTVSVAEVVHLSIIA